LGNEAMRILVPIAISFFFSAATQAREFSVATWNLGWHLSQAEAKEWIKECSQPFAFNTASQLWEPSTSGVTKRGWELKWGRDAKIKWDISLRPPCDVYQANFKIVPVTEAAYDKRGRQIQAFIHENLEADILAFQETSGERAIKEVLPNDGADYHFCSFSGFKVQRLVIAWKKGLGPSSDCVVESAISLPQLDATNQVRPGLSTTLRLDGKQLRILTVHLKSSCVSPLENRGKLDGNSVACEILQKQVVPLEAWLEARALGGQTILLGDFNRNLAHEKNTIAEAQTRTDGSDPKIPLRPGVLVRSLFGEVNDGSPTESTMNLLDSECLVNAVAKDICTRAKSEFFSQEALKPLTRADSLGCRNPIGLDHILISSGLMSVGPTVKVPLGKFGGSRPTSTKFPDPLLALSDHCPLITKLNL
jgi:hypothetical protein